MSKKEIENEVKKIVKKIGFQNDEAKDVKAEVEAFEFSGIKGLTIVDIETSRRSQTWRTSTGTWTFSRNFKLTPKNLKIINEIEKMLGGSNG